MRSHIWRTTGRSWLTNSMVRLSACCRSESFHDGWLHPDGASQPARLCAWAGPRGDAGRRHCPHRLTRTLHRQQARRLGDHLPTGRCWARPAAACPPASYPWKYRTSGRSPPAHPVGAGSAPAWADQPRAVDLELIGALQLSVFRQFPRGRRYALSPRETVTHFPGIAVASYGHSNACFGALIAPFLVIEMDSTGRDAVLRLPTVLYRDAG